MITNIRLILANIVMFISMNYSFAQLSNYSLEQMKKIHNRSISLDMDSCDVIYNSFEFYDKKDIPLYTKHIKNNLLDSNKLPSKYVWLENEKYPNGALIWIGFRNSKYNKTFRRIIHNIKNKEIIEKVSPKIIGIKAVWLTDSLLLLRSPFLYRSVIMSENARTITINEGQITSYSNWVNCNYGLLRDINFLFNGEEVIVDSSINWKLRHKMAINLLARDINKLKDCNEKLDNISGSIILYVDSNKQIKAEVLEPNYDTVRQSKTFRLLENLIQQLKVNLLPNYISIDGHTFNGLFLKFKYENNRFIFYDYRDYP